MSSNGDSSKRIKTSSPTFEQLASSTHPPNNTEYPYDDDDPNDLRTESFPTADQGETPSCGIWAYTHAIAHALMKILKNKKPIFNVIWDNDKSCDAYTGTRSTCINRDGNMLYFIGVRSLLFRDFENE